MIIDSGCVMMLTLSMSYSVKQMCWIRTLISAFLKSFSRVLVV